VRILTRHIDGDKYDAIILKSNPSLVLLQILDEFQCNGILLLPTKHIKGLRFSKFEHLWDRVLLDCGELEKVKRLPWLIKIESPRDMLEECRRRKIWPIVETQSKGASALYIGPITEIHDKGFNLFCYDAAGKWEKNYYLSYKDIFKIEIFDNYSTHFNRFMKKSNPSKLKQTI
jgi:hypothetical protein